MSTPEVDPNAELPLIIDADGFTVCPVCSERVNLARGGKRNLLSHQSGKKCQSVGKLQAKNKKGESARSKFTSFFKQPAIPKVPPTVKTPGLILSTKLPSTPASGSAVRSPCLRLAPASAEPASKVTQTPSTPLARLQNLILKLPTIIPEAGQNHPFAQFPRDLSNCSCIPEGEDAWEVWDGPLNTMLQKAPDELRLLVARGQYGLTAFHDFLVHLTSAHNVDSVLYQNKVERMIEATETVLKDSLAPHNAETSLSDADSSTPLQPDTPVPIGIHSSDDNDIVEIVEVPDMHRMSNPSANVSVLSRPLCPGLVIKLPANQSPHLSYPFALHEELSDPWDYSVKAGQLVLKARNCRGNARYESKECSECASLRKNTSLMGILERMEKGVKEHCPFIYHGTGGMVKLLRGKTEQVRAVRLNRLGDARKLAGKAAVIDLYKEWMMAVGSEKVQRVDRLVWVALNNKRGIRGMLELYRRAVNDTYHPRSYSEEDQLKAIFLWRVGGRRVADMAHLALELPSLRTSRRHSTIPHLISSPGYPLVSEVEQNTLACLSSLSEIIAADPMVKHQIYMLDEIKVEGRPRWDDQTNYILGGCREHCKPASLLYTSTLEVDMFLDEVVDGKVHLASNATVGAIGILSNNHRLYAALPTLISGQCGQETGKQHAKVIQAGLEGIKKSKLRTISIASDGESRRGEALVQLTMKHPLRPTSPIYKHLAILPFMNLDVGDDDITCDKDSKHVLKRCCNLALRARGMRLYGVQILPSMLRVHFLDAGVSASHIDSILHPDDKQDVKLACDFLCEVFRLPSVDDPSRPGFTATREALQTLGTLFRHLLLPYICVDLSLSEQLVHLSAAAHCLLAMAREEEGRSLALLLPSQLYLDIMIMIKNVYFCVAKVKVDTDDQGNFYIILLGTDREEEEFGAVRTMVGNDSGVDMLQLVLRLAGTTEIVSILAQHPEWDKSPRRLKLPVLSKDGLEVHKEVDHLKPASWRGNVSVGGVNLATCWEAGRREVRKIQRLNQVLEELEASGDTEVNLFRPFGKDLIRSKRTAEDYDDTAEDFVDVATPSANSPTSTEALDTAVEEAAIEEAPTHAHSPFFEHDGQKVWKGRYLSEHFKLFKTPGSRDRLKRYADVPRYAMKSNHLESDYMTAGCDDHIPSIRMDTPVASLMKCDDRLFACIGEVNDIVHESKHVAQLPVIQLSEPGTIVSFQLLFLVPATQVDDPSCKNDWRWNMRRGSTYRVPGRLVEPVNPDVSNKEIGKPSYLFQSTTLQVVGSLLLERLTREEGQKIPSITQSPHFLYREADGEACFLCEDSKKEEELLGMKQCPMCKTNLPKAPQRVLEHLGAHILFDPDLTSTSEPCGLCLRASPACEFHLTKGKGSTANPKINDSLSRCANLLPFRYGTAMVAGPNNPCTNVPLKCKFCPTGAPAIWKYNMKDHLKSRHPHLSLPENETLWKISKTERAEMKEIWKKRKVTKKKRKSKKKIDTPLVISEVHSSRLTLLNMTSHADDANIDDDEEDGDGGKDGDTSVAPLQCL